MTETDETKNDGQDGRNGRDEKGKFIEGNPGGPGRHTVFTDEVQKIILASVRHGVSYDASARIAGIVPKTFYNALHKAKEEEQQQLDTELTRFLHELKKAEAEGKSGHLANISRAAYRGFEWTERKKSIKKLANGTEEVTTEEITKFAPPNWTASAWFLERRYPNEFARVNKIMDWRAIAKLAGFDEEAIEADFEYIAEELAAGGEEGDAVRGSSESREEKGDEKKG